MMAQDTTTIFINSKKAAEAVIKSDQPENILDIKKSEHKKFSCIIVQVSGEHVGGEIYKRTLEITGENTVSVEETKNKPGHFDISKTDSKDQLTSGKTISLYLMLNPANPMMMFPSKRIFLGNLVMK
jgi:hypothetical protein